MSEELRLLDLAAAWYQAGEAVALATVIAAWGSAPRPVGSMMAMSDRLHLAGSVSGGCVENAVIDAAREVMRTGIPRCLSFDVTDQSAFAVGLPCGGALRVLVERLG